MRSMKAMAALKPKMDELQKKYGDDRAKIQQEMMGIYKAHGVNPLSGCLPMLLQMPIWLALYRMLSSTGELYLAPFIPGWITDLTATDPYHILPVALMGMMFLQSRMSPATVDNFQQKMMIYGLPLMFGVMSFFFPAGLTVYILTNTSLSLLHTLYMKKFDKGGKLRVVVPPPAAPGKAGKGNAPAKRIVDVEAEEVVDADAEADDNDDGDDEGDEAAVPAKTTPQQRKTNAPRRKRKRKH
jgi:YidC/Oxa1 family membrane protein insertase